jgi:hypothetical protein
LQNILTPYQPLYRWRRTRIDENDPPTMTTGADMTVRSASGGSSGSLHGPMKGKWMWNVLATHVRLRVMPQSGYIDEGREAMRMAEERYHDLMRKNDLRGSQDVD